MQSFSIGVDLGGTNMRVAAIEDTGRQLETVCASAAVNRGRDSVIAEMCNIIREIAGKFTRSHKFAGVGVGVPGVIDMDTGTVFAAANLPGWTNYPVKDEIQKQLGTAVILENDSNCAALGEKWMGVGREANGLCMVTLGTGVGGAFIFNGTLWHGMLGMAGEIGHMTVTPDGPSCGCGNRGCLEQFASATAIKRMAEEAVARGKFPELASAMAANPDASAKVVFQYALHGDAAAREIFVTVGWALGVVISSLVDALNLPVYAIGGGVSSAWDVFSPALFQELRKRSIVFRASDPEKSQLHQKKTIVTRALLASDAGLIGAARLPLLSEDSLVLRTA
ncbi:MAG TPA: ROK family protein [Verrucomicrobiae bacterium]|jgi:glucokinase|nr:ROK family protein [Verrucomicrobiae bacterium]